MSKYKDAVKEFEDKQEKELAAFKAMQVEKEIRDNARREETLKIRLATEETKARLESDYGIEGNPKRDVLWNIAYEWGHSSGLSEVERVYDDLVELIK